MNPEKSGRFAVIPARAVEDRRIGPATVRVLAALSTYSDKDGWCWPAVRTIANRVNVSRQAVQQHLRRLINAGYIEVRPRTHENGRNKSNMYRLLFDRALFVVAESAEKVGQAHLALGEGEGKVSLHSKKPELSAVPSSETAEKVGQGELAGEGKVSLAQNVLIKNERKNIGESEKNPPDLQEKQVEKTEPLYAGKTAKDWFNEFWRIIPKRLDGTNSKARSLDRFSKHLKAGVPPAEIIAGAERERARLGEKHEFAFGPQNWLRDRGWENAPAQQPDEQSEWAKYQ